MKRFEINTFKKEEVLNYLNELKEHFKDNIAFECVLSHNENDFLDYLEDNYFNKNHNYVKDLVEDFVIDVSNYLNIKASNVFAIGEDVIEFRKYIMEAFNNARPSEFWELEKILTEKAVSNYFKEQFKNNVENIIPYLATVTIISHIEGLSDEKLYENSVSLPDENDIIEYFNMHSYEYITVDFIKRSYDYFITLIPF